MRAAPPIFAVVLLLVGGLALCVVIAVARDPGPTPTDAAIGYAAARAAGDFDAMYRLTSDVVLHGQNRDAWIAERRARPREVQDPAAISARSTVVTGERAHVELSLSAGGERAGVDLVLRQRIWLVEAFGTPDPTS